MDNTVDIRADERLRKHCRYSAFLGAGVWLTAACFLPRGENGMIAALLLFVPLVLFRLGFAFLIPRGPVRRHRWWRFASYAQLPAAIALTFAFFEPAGGVAVALTIPWLIFTLLLAGLACDRLAHAPRPEIEDWGRLAAMFFLPVGAGWAMLSRGGLQPLHFREMIVLLTAIHFHYAGFALPLMAGELVRERRDRTSKALLIAVLVGVPLVAIGIASTQLGGPREIEFSAALLLATTGIALGAANLRTAFRWRNFVGGLLAISGVSLIVALGWSAVYAAGQYGLIERINIPFMVHWHGAINAVGAALCGLFGWHLVITRATKPEAIHP
jgi:hypothetical protein